MSDAADYLAAAQSAATVLTTKWFPESGPQTWVGTYWDFWRTPNLIGALIRLMTAEGSQTYVSTVNAGPLAFDPYWTPPYSPGYYDDEGWWAMQFLDAHTFFQGTGPDGWTKRAIAVYQDMAAGWDDVCEGGVWQERNPKSYPGNFKGSISTELYMAIGGRLANLAGIPSDPSYLSGAQRAWAWIDKHLVDENFLIWGQLDAHGQIYRPNVPHTYTQGVVLTGRWELYLASKDTSLLDAAQSGAQAAIDHMTWPGGILREPCEVDATCGPSDSNPALFKGIYARSLAALVVGLRGTGDQARIAVADTFAAFLRANADAVIANFPGGIFGMDWHQPQPNYQPTGNTVYDGCLQFSALELFLAAALVS